MGNLVDRLAAHLRGTPDAERPIAGRVGGALWLVAPIATTVLPLFPQATAPVFPWIALVAPGAGPLGGAAKVAIGAVLLGGRQLLTAMRASAERLSEEHDALRSIATAVAAGAAPEAVFNLAAERAARLLGADGAGIISYDPDGWQTIVGTWSSG